MILVKKSSGHLNLIADIDFSLLQVWLGHAKTTHVEPQSFYHTYHLLKRYELLKSSTKQKSMYVLKLIKWTNLIRSGLCLWTLYP